MIKFSLPDYCDHQKIINFFLTLQEKLPEAFYDNRIIDSAYGLPGHLIWNGGRVMVPRCSPQDYYEIVQTYHDNFPNFHLRHTLWDIFSFASLPSFLFSLVRCQGFWPNFKSSCLLLLNSIISLNILDNRLKSHVCLKNTFSLSVAYLPIPPILSST